MDQLSQLHLVARHQDDATSAGRQRRSTAEFSSLTLELVLVLIGSLLLPDQDLGGHVQTDNTRVGHQEEHDELLAHHPQRLVLPTVD